MLKRILITLGLLITANLVIAQGILVGTITDAKTGEPSPFVNVIVTQNGQQMGGAATDIDGNFQIKNLNPGTYDMQASFMGYKSVLKTGIKVSASGFSREGNIQMEPTSEMLDVVEVVERAVPLIDIGAAEQGKRLSAEEIEKMSATSVDGIIASVGGITDNGDGSAGSARGESDMQNYVNGAKKQGSVNVPKSAIQEIQVILGGTPASIGEAIGGSTMVTLRPPQNKFEVMVSYRTSEPFDTRGYHRGEFYLTGPVWTKTSETGSEKTILGFRLSGFESYVHDPYRRPKDRWYFMSKDDVRQRIEQSPLVLDPTTGSIQYAASYLTADDFKRVGRKPNLWSNTVYLEGGFQTYRNNSIEN